MVYVPTQAYDGNYRSANLTHIQDYVGRDFFHVVKGMPYVNITKINLDSYNIPRDIHDILRSDIFRYHILRENGGVWSDFDVLWLRPMSHLKDIECIGKVGMSKAGATACLRHMVSGWHNISVLISQPDHPLYSELIRTCNDLIKNKTVAFEHQEFGTSMWNKLYPNLEALNSRFPDVVGLKYETFFPYPIDNGNMDLLYLQTDLSVINDNVMCAHWFNGHRLSKEYINAPVWQECSMTELRRQYGGGR